MEVSNKNLNYIQYSDLINGRTDVTPERRLWVAVIITLINDYIDAVKQAADSYAIFGSAGEHLKWRIEEFRRLITDEWLKEICEHVNLSTYHLQKRFDRADAEFNLQNIKWLAYSKTKRSRVEQVDE